MTLSVKRSSPLRVSMDFDCTLAISTPLFPQLHPISPFHALLLSYFSPNSFILTARQPQDIPPRLISPFLLTTLPIITVKPDVDLFIDDRSVNYPSTFNDLLSAIPIPNFPVLFATFLLDKGFHFSNTFIFRRTLNSFVDVAFPFFSQSVHLCLPEHIFDVISRKRDPVLITKHPTQDRLALTCNNQDLLGVSLAYYMTPEDTNYPYPDYKLYDQYPCLPFFCPPELTPDFSKMEVY